MDEPNAPVPRGAPAPEAPQSPRTRLHRAQPVAIGIRPPEDRKLPGDLLECLERYLAFEEGITPIATSARFEDVDGGPEDSPSLRLQVRVPERPQPASMVLLAHPECLEVFAAVALKDADGKPVFLVGEGGADLVPYAVESPVRRILKLLREEWPAIFTEATEIELRIFGRGEGRIPLARFRPMQLRCLYEMLPRIRDVHECKFTCFDGALTKSLAMVKSQQEARLAGEGSEEG